MTRRASTVSIGVDVYTKLYILRLMNTNKTRRPLLTPETETQRAIRLASNAAVAAKNAHSAAFNRAMDGDETVTQEQLDALEAAEAATMREWNRLRLAAIGATP